MPVSPMRVAMLSAHSCPVGKLGTKDTGGMSVYIRELARELADRGHIVDVYTRVHDPEDREIYELARNARLIHLKAGEDEEMQKLDVYSHLPDFACNLERYRRQSDLRYDLIFSHYWLSGLAGAYLQQRWHVPHMIMFHTLGAVKNRIKEEARLANGGDEPELRIETERRLVGSCHRIIASTPREQEDLIRYYGASLDKINVVPCGVNLGQFKVIDRTLARQHLGFGEERIILYVGRLDPLKGIDKLIEALPLLSHIPGVRLVVIGGGEDSQHEVEQLRGLARGLGVQDAVSFVGLVKHEQLPYFYSAADVCVVPSHYESFGLVVLESLACGTPVVATDVGNHRDVIRDGETGYVVTDNTPGRLAEKIALLLCRTGADKGSALLCRSSVSRFGWSGVAQSVVSDCQEVLAHYLVAAS